MLSCFLTIAAQVSTNVNKLIILIIDMSQLDYSILRDLGVKPVPGPIELPLYARFRPEVISGTNVRSVQVDISRQELFAVLLQLTDMRHFRR